MSKRLARAPIIPLLIALLGFGLRVFRLGFQELRGDEAFGYFFSLAGPREIVAATLALAEPHPVASYLVQHAWLNLAGHSEFSLRFVSAWFGALSVALGYRLGRDAGLSRPAASVGSLLIALSPYALWHSQDARMYSMSLALTLASTILALRFVRRPAWVVAAAYVALSLLALHTHYYAAFVIVAQNVWVLLRVLADSSFRRRVLRPWFALQASFVILYLPWLIAARTTLSGYHGNGDSPGLWEALMRTARVLAAGEMAPMPLRTAAALLAAALLVLLVVKSSPPLLTAARRGGQGERLVLLALILCVPLAATWLGAQARPIFNERYLIAAAPGLYLLIAALVDLIDRRVAAVGIGAFLALGLAAASYYYVDPTYSKSRGWRDLATALTRMQSGFAAQDAWVVENAADPTLWYYFPQQVERWALPPTPNDAAGAERVVADLVARGVQRVIVPLTGDPGWDGSGIAEAALSRQYAPLMTFPVRDWQIAVSDRQSAPLAPIAAEFAGGLRLTDATFAPAVIAPGGLVGVHLAWRTPQAGIAPGTKITVQALGADGLPAAQGDEALQITDDASSHALLLPSDLRPGAYPLIVALYDGNAADLPRLHTSSGADAVQLGVLTVQ